MTPILLLPEFDCLFCRFGVQRSYKLNGSKLIFVAIMTINGVDSEAMLNWKDSISFVCDFYEKGRIPLLVRELR